MEWWGGPPVLGSPLGTTPPSACAMKAMSLARSGSRGTRADQGVRPTGLGRMRGLGGATSTAESLAGVEGAQGEGEDGLEDPSEHLPHQQQADDAEAAQRAAEMLDAADRKSTRLNSSH